MQNLLTAVQMRSADAFTIQQKGISSIELMETASIAFVEVFSREVSSKETAIGILCGKGNNGADGLAIARLLQEQEYLFVTVYLISFSDRETEEYSINLKLLRQAGFQPVLVHDAAQLSDIKDEVLIDAVLGSGLNKPLAGAYAELATVINTLERKVIAVDIPTGFPSDGPLSPGAVYLKATLAICFQRPKINFFFPEALLAMQRFIVADIGLDEDFIQEQDSAYQLSDVNSLKQMIKPRALFSHKGTYGHALIVAGQAETMGAALLAATGCLYSGAGLTTLAIPASGLTALNSLLPEVMYTDRDDLKADLSSNKEKFKAIAIGPGLGTAEDGRSLVNAFFALQKPLVIDADALNILAEDKGLLDQLPSGSVLTPHMKEFDHLYGEHHSWWDRLQTARETAEESACVIVLKNQYTFIVSPDGHVVINPTGNPGMAQGGMGDVLTGIIVSFLAQGYSAAQASAIACYLHGAAGDDLFKSRSNVTASALGRQVPVVLKGLTK